MHLIENERLTASVSDIARQLCLSERTVHRLIKTGELPSIKIGRRRLVQVVQFKAWLSGLETPKP